MPNFDNKYKPLTASELAKFEERIVLIKSNIHKRMLDFSMNDDHHPALKDFLGVAKHILLSNNAKRIRCILPVLIAKQCQFSEDECMDYGVIVELLHYTSLIHDDVIDGDHYRRNQKTLNNTFSNPQSVLIGDFIICTAVNYCLSFTHNKQVTTLVLKAIQDLVTGVIIEQRWLLKEPTIERYQEMAVLKTGSLFALSFGLPFVGQDSLKKALKCGEIFGILFQIYDDYQDRNDDDPRFNIFGLLTKKEIIIFWDKQVKEFMDCCRKLNLQSTASILFHHLHEIDYFNEISTSDGILFHIPNIIE